MSALGQEHGLLVRQITPLCSLQDLGRIGYRAQGVTRSGAMDRFNLQVANALVGNPANTACLEFTLAGGQFELSSQSARIAVAGDFELLVNKVSKDSYSSHWIQAGDTIELMRMNSDSQHGLRCYLAVEGGFAAEAELGSCSTHARSLLGGFTQPLQSGIVLPLVTAFAAKGTEFNLRHGLRRPLQNTIRVVPGPQDDQFTNAGIECFYAGQYVVSDECDRMGMRLSGPTIEHKGNGNIISDPVLAGSIQVPAGGQPIILMADGPTTGGYPKIATVASVDLAALAQLGPGAQVQFDAISVEESQQLVKAERQFFAQLPYRLDRCRDMLDLAW